MKKILRICFVAAVFMILSCSLVSAATWRIGCVPDRGDNTSGIVVRLTNKKKKLKSIHMLLQRDLFTLKKMKEDAIYMLP